MLNLGNWSVCTQFVVDVGCDARIYKEPVARPLPSLSPPPPAVDWMMAEKTDRPKMRLIGTCHQSRHVLVRRCDEEAEGTANGRRRRAPTAAPLKTVRLRNRYRHIGGTLGLAKGASRTRNACDGLGSGVLRRCFFSPTHSATSHEASQEKLLTTHLGRPVTGMAAFGSGSLFLILTASVFTGSMASATLSCMLSTGFASLAFTFCMRAFSADMSNLSSPLQHNISVQKTTCAPKAPFNAGASAPHEKPARPNSPRILGRLGLRLHAKTERGSIPPRRRAHLHPSAGKVPRQAGGGREALSCRHPGNEESAAEQQEHPRLHRPGDASEQQAVVWCQSL
jgi:hypothetical protein